MSFNMSYLVLRLEGPFQSWGHDSQFDYRKTALMPTKSAIAGMCCAALGYKRGSESERKYLGHFSQFTMKSIAIPKPSPLYKESYFEVRRLKDYHTVKDTRKAGGGTKNSHLTYRFYLQDSLFGIVLNGEKQLIETTSKALQNPIWGVWLGRKSCIPSSPVYVGIFESEESAFEVLVGNKTIDEFTHQLEAEKFEEGDDSILDQPVFFGSAERDKEYVPRRVKTKIGKLK